METPSTGRPRFRFEAGRRFGIVTLVIAMVAMGSAGWTRVAAQDDVAPLSASALAQLTPGSEPSLTVTGYGEATAPADSALIQLLIGRVQADFGMGIYDGSGSSVVVGADSTQGEVIEGTPGAGAPEPGISPMPIGPGMPEPIDETALEPILTALTGAGIPSDAVEVVISPIASDPYAGPYGGAARLEFTVETPVLAELTDLMTTVSQTALESGLSLIQAGTAYEVEDCQALEDEAQIAAIEDARQRAERLAGQLGVTTGATLLASDFGFFGDPSLGGCGFPDGAGSYASYGGPGSLSLTIPDFDPSRPAEVTVIKQIYLGLAIT